MREDKLVEVRGAFGYEVKLTKIEHLPRDREHKKSSYVARRKESAGADDHKGGQQDRRDSYHARDDKSHKNAKHHEKDKRHGRRGTGKDSKDDYEEYYVKKDDKQVGEEPKEDAKKSGSRKDVKKHGRRKDSEEFVWAPKDQGTKKEDSSQSNHEKTDKDAAQ